MKYISVIKKYSTQFHFKQKMYNKRVRAPTVNHLQVKYDNSNRVMAYLRECQLRKFHPSMSDISKHTSLNIDTTERIIYAMFDLGHVVRFRDRVDNSSRFRLFCPEGQQRKFARREQSNSSRTESQEEDSE